MPGWIQEPTVDEVQNLSLQSGVGWGVSPGCAGVTQGRSAGRLRAAGILSLPQADTPSTQTPGYGALPVKPG